MPYASGKSPMRLRVNVIILVIQNIKIVDELLTERINIYIYHVEKESNVGETHVGTGKQEQEQETSSENAC